MRKTSGRLIAAAIAATMTAGASAQPMNTSLQAQAQAAGLPAINGCVLYADGWSSENAETGIYSLPLAEGEQFGKILLGPSAIGIYTDGMYVQTSHVSLYGMYIVTVKGYDVETGEIRFTDVSYGSENIPVALASDPYDGTVYGVFYNADATAFEFGTISYADGYAERTGTICDIYADICNLAIHPDGDIYAISRVIEEDADENTVVTSSTLNKIDRTTGELTPVGLTGHLPYYVGGAVIDPATGRMFWTVSPQQGGYIAEINLQTGEATKLFDFPRHEEVTGLYIPEAAPDANAPGEVKDVEFDFPVSSLGGNVNVTAPSALFGGGNPTGTCTIHVLANREEIAAMDGVAYGSRVAVPVSLPEMGTYTFTIYASNEVGNGPRTNITGVLVGGDTPVPVKATLAYEDGEMKLTWLPVTESVGGNRLEAGSVTYDITRYPGEVKVASALAATSFAEAIAEPADLTTYYYVITATSNGLTSVPAESNRVTLGSALPPYASDWNETDLGGWTSLDANGDGTSWEIWTGSSDPTGATETKNTVRIGYNSSIAMDDWFFSVPFRMEVGKAYLVKFSTYSNSDVYPERIEVKYGNAATAEAMTGTLLPATVLTNDETTPLVVEKYLIPEATGVYTIGFHGISDADQFYLYLADFSVSAALSANTPETPAEMTVIPDSNGALSAEISLKAPTLNIAGEQLSALTKIEVRRGETLVKTFENPAPGSTLTFTDTPTEAGQTDYSATAFTADGESVAATASAYIGIPVPGVTDAVMLTRTENDGEVTVSWNPIVTNVDGFPINPDLVKYIVAKSEGGNWIPITDELTETSVTFQAVAPGNQQFVQYAVFGVTEAGQGQGVISELIAAGTPYRSFSESFPDGGLSGNILATNTTGMAGISVYTDGFGLSSQDGDGGFINFTADSKNKYADLITGLVKLDDTNPAELSFYTYLFNDGTNPDMNEIEVFVKRSTDPETEWTSVYMKTVCDIAAPATELGWYPVTVDLSSYRGETIQVMWRNTIRTYGNLPIDNIRIYSAVDHNVEALGISAPDRAICGEDFEVTVDVKNTGRLAAENIAVALYADNEEVARQEVAKLESWEKITLNFDCMMPGVATEPVEYRAEVIWNADEQPSDNATRSVAVEPLRHDLPTVTLSASSDDGKVELSWNEPELSTESGVLVTEDFEKAEPFYPGYGFWTFVDLDKRPVGGIDGMPIPGVASGVTKGSYWVWDTDQLGTGNTTYSAHSGTRFLFALYNSGDLPVDDWAISPVLDGSAQTVSFYAKSYNPTYPEKIEVYYSTGSLDPADFVLVNEAVTLPAEWTLIEAQLPEGAKHFAIRSCSEGALMLMIDDVTYRQGANTHDAELRGYELYRDGEKLHDGLLEETVYTDYDVTEGETHTYSVVAVYDKGMSTPSNEVTVQVSGVADMRADNIRVIVNGCMVEVLGAEDVVISDMTGRVICTGRGDTRAEVVPGVYAVKADTRTLKLIVR